MYSHYDPDHTGLYLSGYAEDLYHEYLDYWELQNVPKDSQLSAEQRQLFRRLHAIAKTLTACLHSLRPGPQTVNAVRDLFATVGDASVNVNNVNDDVAARTVRAIDGHPIIRDGIKLDLALQAVDSLLAGAETRAANLLALLADRELSERAAAFLDRATRLYLWGFEPEAVVMCASALEAAYEARFPPEEMIRLQVQKKGNDYEPSEYEKAAIAAGVFSKDLRERAARIRRARNDILHNAPVPVLKPLGALRDTALLLQRLFPGSTPAT